MSHHFEAGEAARPRSATEAEHQRAELFSKAQIDKAMDLLAQGFETNSPSQSLKSLLDSIDIEDFSVADPQRCPTV